MSRVRRVVQITEVKKHWKDDPESEGGFLDLMQYNAKKDKLELLEDNLKESDIFTKISSLTGLSIEKIWENIRMLGSSKVFLVAMKNEFKLPELLEAENSVIAHNKLLLLKQRRIDSSATQTQLLHALRNVRRIRR